MRLERTYLGCHVLGFALIILAVLPRLAHADAEDYERGVKLLEKARQQREFERRRELVDEAEAAFHAFLRTSPEHRLACSARTQIGNILVERARMQMEHARDADGNAQAEARGLYEQAYHSFEATHAGLVKELSKLRHIDSADREKLVRRDQLRANYLQCQLLMAAVLEESADTYDLEDAGRQEVLAKAAKEYAEIYDKYRTRLAGLYARLYQSRCLKKLGQCAEALQRLEELLDQPDAPAFSALKPKAQNLAMECWLDDSQKQYQQAVTRGDDWLKKCDAQKLASPDWLGLQFRLARAHWLLVESLDDAEPRITHREKARALAEFVADREGIYQDDARKLLIEIGDNNTAAEPQEPEFFGGAMAAGRETLEEIQEIRKEMAREGISAVAVDIEPELETIDAEPAAKPDPFQLKLKQKQAEAIRHFLLALKLADDQTPRQDVDLVRYFLCFLYYSDGAYDKAAELGDELSRNPDATGARQSAKIALASYMKIYQSQPPKGKEARGVVKRLEALADRILEKWQEEPVAVETLDSLIAILIREDRAEDSISYLEKVPADSPRRNRAASRVGAALWRSYLLGTQRLRTWERDGGPGPDVDVEVVKKQLAKAKEQAADILSDAIKQARNSQNITYDVVMATLSLVQLHWESVEFQRAVSLLEDPTIGPLTLVQGNHPATQRPFVRREICKTAIRAYGALDQEEKAEPLRKLLNELDEDG